MSKLLALDLSTGFVMSDGAIIDAKNFMVQIAQDLEEGVICGP